ncbi:MAG: beta-ketoacyl-[acyl-carrier-protein] synthase family protein [Myxococcales bacterium]|nr:beta-ketoacyl-[acyl-carrier-protein] synthase family protein [Myxococcota bacterium]MDW8283012.1 beta-ketoacyl-[acyl-carrier-protein] synthase family protein [Myxococcales bacterium]
MISSRHEVLVTGMGAVTALGPDLASFAAGLQAGRTGIRRLTLFDPSGYRSELCGQVAEPDFPDVELPPSTSRPDRFGLRAALDAVRDADLPVEALRGAAVAMGTGTGGALQSEEYVLERLAGRYPDARLLVGHQPAAVTDLIARLLGIRGPRNTIMTACSSSAVAIAWAADLIACGEVEVALAGGAEGLCRLTVAGFSALRATSPELCRPFDANRQGLNLGEGAAVLVLESEKHAQRRGARVYGRIAGYGMTTDAYHMTAPHPDGAGAARAMRIALANAGLPPEAIGYINAHGTGTPHNDVAETRAIHAVFGAWAPRIPVSSIKSMVGHTLGAAGAIEAVASLLALSCGFLPPTVNHERAEEGFNLDFIPGQARAVQVEAVLSSSFAFGGNNAVLIFTRTPG